MKTKLCKKCNKTKPINEFYKNKNSPDGRFAWCKTCKSLSDKQSHKKHKEIRNKNSQKYYNENKEEISDSRKNKRKTDLEFVKKEKERSKKYRDNNKEKIRENKKKYYQDNKEKINANFVKRRHEDLDFRLKNNMRSRLSHALKNKTKGGKTIDYLGCSMEELRLHLKSQFQENMTWENYGSEWHIDHIKPCCLFDFSKEEEIKLCFNYQNLQPLWKLDNMRKNKYYQGQ